jgi:predicted nucleic acid-binding protein
VFVLDADVVTQVYRKNPVVLRRIDQHLNDVGLGVVMVEEMMRGALAAVNTARTLKTDERVAYNLLCDVFEAMREFQVLRYEFQVLRYTDEAHRIYKSFTRSQLDRGKNDCRLAAIALAHGSTVVTRNTRHFEGLVAIENWME